MNVLSYLKIHKSILVFLAILAALVHLVLLSSSRIDTALPDILYLDLLILVISLIFGISAYSRWIRRYRCLRQSLDENRNIGTELPAPEDFYTIILRDVAKNMEAESENRVGELKKAVDEINDYMTRWVHEVKMPVSVCELILERMREKDLALELQTELERVKFLTNQALYISRASSYSEDLTVREITLGNLVKSAVKRNSTLLISKDIEVILSNTDYPVLSDEKWISYVLDQLLNNACKYMNRGGRIEIGAAADEQNNITLRIRDNGIGILQKDISRIFDKSFTGNNTANLTKSTGMGLYISKKMLDRLGHKIAVVSEPGVFTEFSVTFYALSDSVYQIEKRL